MKTNSAFTLLLFFLFLFSCDSNKNTSSFELDPVAEKEIDALIKKMSVEEKVGQTCQITLDAILQKDVANVLIEPHQIDLKKLEEAIDIYKVGSILNVSNHTFTLENWNSGKSHEFWLKDSNHLWGRCYSWGNIHTK
jgi:beta-glucosidase